MVKENNKIRYLHIDYIEVTTKCMVKENNKISVNVDIVNFLDVCIQNN